jgi:hypothetical protein
MLELRAAARRIGGLNAALACLAVLAGCGPAAGAAGAASAARSPGAVAGPASEAGAASQAGTGSAGSPSAGPPAAKAVKHVDFLNGVSCASAANCTAVGDYYRTAAGPQVTLVERWNGTAWRIEPSPGTGRGVTLDSVPCPGATSCTAVGSPVIGWNGVSWKAELRSSPFTSISCAAPDSCMAVGVTSGGQPQSGYFDGRNWTLEPMPRPGHPAQSITLAAVSCAGPGFCVAVGDYSSGVAARPSPTARDKTLAERWNGSSWQLTGSADVARWDQLSAVSCTSPRACTAVGSSTSGQFTLAERRDGAGWQPHLMPSPPQPEPYVHPPAYRAPGPTHASRSAPTAAHSPRPGPARTGRSRPPPVHSQARQPGRAELSTRDSWCIPRRGPDPVPPAAAPAAEHHSGSRTARKCPRHDPLPSSRTLDDQYRYAP